ncbi:MAG: hypothetical protein JWO13_3214 [Acidobacteriales bacterium]|nr:hypothetical protein [Terriglobales bacterium]
MLDVCEWDDREPRLLNKGRVFESGIGFDLRKRCRLRKRLAGFYLYEWFPGIVRIHRNDARAADRPLLPTSVIDDELVSRFHLAQVLNGSRIGDSVPCGVFVALKISE